MYRQIHRCLFIQCFLLFLVFINSSCSKDNEFAENINDYIKSLDYDKESLLFERNISGNLERTETGSLNQDYAPVNGKYRSCEGNSYKLERNFDNISILRPTNDVIWPGALVYADSDLWKGLPRPITLERSEMQLRVDLPGMGSKGNLKIKNPDNTNVQTAIDEALEWWNENAYQEGYVNPSSTEYESTIVHSSSQLALEVSMNAEWATGAVSSQLDYDQSSSKDVAVMVFKQVFYNISMNTPSDPASVFGGSVDMAQVETSMDAQTPPAYISNVAYGRIIMFRMEVEKNSTSLDLEAILSYASGVSGDLEVKEAYDAVLNRSSIKVITIGGNAEVASEAVEAKSVGSLNHILKGTNAVYSRDNPGVPIAYTVKFLKDNALAKMGYTADYNIEDCSEKKFKHKDILVKNKFKTRNIRVKMSYKPSSGPTYQGEWLTIKDETNEGKLLEPIPDGAYNVKLTFEKFVLFDGWRLFKEVDENHIDSNKKSCWVAYEKNNEEYLRYCVDEH